MNNNIITEYWFNRPITYNKDKYLLETNTKGVTIIDKKTDNIVFQNEYISMIKQINNTEFIAIAIENLPTREAIFYHLNYNETTNKTEILFANIYKYKSLITTYRELENIYIMDSFLDTTLYNPTTKESLTLEDSTIYNDIYTNNEGNSYISGKVKITTDSFNSKFYDDLIMLIDTSTLEFNEFYSTKQDRIILLSPDEAHNFIDSFNTKVETEIIKYLEILEEQEKLYREQLNNKALNKLIKKKELKRL